MLAICGQLNPILGNIPCQTLVVDIRNDSPSLLIGPIWRIYFKFVADQICFGSSLYLPDLNLDFLLQFCFVFPGKLFQGNCHFATSMEDGCSHNYKVSKTIFVHQIENTFGHLDRLRQLDSSRINNLS